MSLPQLDGLRQMAAAYDGVILDLWGVVHDGSALYPGARDCLEHLRRLGKRVVLLSNAPRRAQSLVALLQDMGLPRSAYTDVMSSGEAVHDALLQRRDPWFQALGDRCLHVGPARDRHLYDALGLTVVEAVEAATFLLNTGPDAIGETLAQYQPILDQAARAGLPMVCANPDLVVMQNGQALLCAGALGRYYQEIGGDVRYRGKPDPAIYDICFAQLGVGDRRRILAVGDAFHTDMAGAAAVGIDAVLCTGGIHALDLGTTHGHPADPIKLAQLLAQHPTCPPIAAIPALVW
jgi:HAD superfamily hydrolase (TIGR01459 family)